MWYDHLRRVKEGRILKVMTEWQPERRRQRKKLTNYVQVI